MWMRLLVKAAPNRRHHRSVLSRFASSSNEAKPFEKVLIANRGEIVERVVRTCRQLDIATVAVYSTADVKSRFVQQADEAVCIGPAAASQSYLNVDAILDAAHKTGAQAIHPGYGFLSENAKFAQTVLDAGFTWLGPPPHAVEQLGDKLLSKVLAKKAGVNTVPGYQDQVESLQHALQICNEMLGYPVLLKAAAGGGGKGMRVCYNDRDVKEAWGIAKSEAKSFFSDDRLLVEKYIEKPHHIEFQILAGKKEGELQVVVFPERECSIQRRNQKIIEESPSCLLSEDTRQAMAAQCEQLCRTVEYQSAGTVEFLVDEQENFFFLEQNTRLQVEHPVTEAICGVDLVKGMLWVGAGWGLPPEFHQRNGLIMPHKGHAIEARIYAEDPLRGFLPSTGPLTPYSEPSMSRNTTESFVRIDSGVCAGHVVSPFYDPMLSKVIAYGPTRSKAIDGLCEALDEYVIEGVRHNARLVQAVLRHDAFRAGETPTSFLPTHFPDGFHGVSLTDTETEEFAVAAAVIASTRQRMLQAPPLAGSHNGSVVVRLGGMFGAAHEVMLHDDHAIVRDLSKDCSERTVKLDAPVVYKPLNYLAHVSLDGERRCVQVVNEDTTGEYKMQMYGADMKVLIQSPREFELFKYMHEPVAVDTSDLILSPMPGALISFAVCEGDEVEEGQELCIVEAMKMQNIIRSPRHGKIGSLSVSVGASLATDQVILEFEKAETECTAQST